MCLLLYIQYIFLLINPKLYMFYILYIIFTHFADNKYSDVFSLTNIMKLQMTGSLHVGVLIKKKCKYIFISI